MIVPCSPETVPETGEHSIQVTEGVTAYLIVFPLALHISNFWAEAVLPASHELTSELVEAVMVPLLLVTIRVTTSFAVLLSSPVATMLAVYVPATRELVAYETVISDFVVVAVPDEGDTESHD